MHEQSGQPAVTERERIIHDLRSPLHALNGYLDLAIADNDDVELARLLAGARRASSELEQLIADLSGAPDPAGEIDIAHLVTSIVEMLRPLARGHEIVLDTDPGVVAVVPERTIRRIVTNLVSNALRHSPDGSVITVRVKQTPAAIVIDDEGPGPDSIPTAGDSAGHLGLVIVRELVSRIGGQFAVEQRDPVGSRVIVRLEGPYTAL